MKIKNWKLKISLIAFFAFITFNTFMRKLILNLGTSLLSLIIFIGIIEIGLRVTGLQSVKPNPPKIFQTSEHEDISYELIPNLENEKAYKGKVSTNSLGFRGPELEEGKPTIALFGDSITFGYGVYDDQTLGAYMRELLTGYNVINTAAPGYNLRQQTGIIRQKLNDIDPEIVVLVFYFNDLTDDTGFLDDEGILRPEGWDPEQEKCKPITSGAMSYLPGKCWLADHSAFYKAFKKVYDLQASKRTISEEREISINNPEIDSVESDSLELYSVQLEIFSKLIPQTKKIFVIWPDHELHEQSRPRLKQIAEAYDFQVIDLYDTFSNTAETLPWDTVHPSPNTLEQAAQVITNNL